MEKFIVNPTPNIPKDIIGPSHRYRTDKGEISLLHPCRATWNTYEICCLAGGLFEDIEWFETLEEAENRINELLKP